MSVFNSVSESLWIVWDTNPDHRAELYTIQIENLFRGVKASVEPAKSTAILYGFEHFFFPAYIHGSLFLRAAYFYLCRRLF